MWDLETNLAALADSVETVEPEQERQFLEDFRQALMQAKEKRDRVASFLAYCEAMAEMGVAEGLKCTITDQRSSCHHRVGPVLPDGPAVSKAEVLAPAAVFRMSQVLPAKGTHHTPRS